MPLTHQERVRRQVCGQVIPSIAQLLYQADKGSLLAKLADLSEDGRAVYLADAMVILSADQRQERVMRVQRADAHTHALKGHERESIQWRARHDIARYDANARRCCHICGELVLTNEASLFISPTRATVVHGLCCAKDEARYEFISEFQYRARDIAASGHEGDLLGDGRR